MTATVTRFDPAILLYALRHALGKKKLGAQIEQAVRENIDAIQADTAIRDAMLASIREFHFWPSRPDLPHWLTIIDLLEGRTP